MLFLNYKNELQFYCNLFFIYARDTKCSIYVQDCIYLMLKFSGVFRRDHGPPLAKIFFFSIEKIGKHDFAPSLCDH